MGHQQDSVTPCGRMVPSPANPLDQVGCQGTKTTVYVYDDNGQCTSQQAWPCSSCGQG